MRLTRVLKAGTHVAFIGLKGLRTLESIPSDCGMGLFRHWSHTRCLCS